MALEKDTSRSVKWRKVKGAKPWRPDAPSTLVGEFIGVKSQHGKYGDYQCVYVMTHEGVYTVSGTVLMNLIHATPLREGALIRIDFLGRKGENGYKDFDLYVESPVRAVRPEPPDENNPQPAGDPLFYIDR